MNRSASQYVSPLARARPRHAGLNTGGATRRRIRSNAASGTAGDWGVVRHRDVSAIDRQLSLLVAVSASIRRLGGKPFTALREGVVDERIASRPTGLRLGASGAGSGHGNANQRD